MDLTRDNFDLEWPGILRELQRAEFISVDFEMTGIRMPAIEAELEFRSSVEAHFPSKYQVAQHYTVVQVGFCLFTRVERQPTAVASASKHTDASADELAADVPPTYEARPFTAFVFPGDGASDVTLNVETTGAFLADNDVDFNKWIRSGVRYLSHASQHARRTTLGSNEDGDAPGVVVVSDAVKAQIRRLEAEIEGLPPGDANVARDTVTRIKAFANSVDIEATIKAPFVRSPDAGRIVDTIARLMQLTKKVDRTQPQGSQHFWLHPGKVHSSRPHDHSSALGFTKFFDAIAALKKPIIVHNGFSDLLFYHAWFAGTPVESYADFQKRIHETFPHLYDTRVIQTHPSVPYDPKLPNTLYGFHAGIMARLGSSAANVVLPLGFAKFSSGLLRDCRNTGSAFHDAGFDALLTGIVFANARIEIQRRADAPIFSCAPREVADPDYVRSKPQQGGRPTSAASALPSTAAPPRQHVNEKPRDVSVFEGHVGVHACMHAAVLRPGAPDHCHIDGVVLSLVVGTPKVGGTTIADCGGGCMPPIGRLVDVLDEIGLFGRVQVAVGGKSVFVFIKGTDVEKGPGTFVERLRQGTVRLRSMYGVETSVYAVVESLKDMMLPRSQSRSS